MVMCMFPLWAGCLRLKAVSFYESVTLLYHVVNTRFAQLNLIKLTRDPQIRYEHSLGAAQKAFETDQLAVHCSESRSCEGRSYAGAHSVLHVEYLVR